MYKIWVVAVREYRAMVATRAFLVSLVMMPVLMLGSVAAMELLKNAGAVEERKIAVLDPGNLVFPRLKELAEAENRLVRARSESEEAAGKESRGDLPQMAAGELLLLEAMETPVAETDREQLLVSLSEQIRTGKLYAVLELIYDPKTGPQTARFYAQDSSISSSRSWLQQKINEMVKNDRLVKAEIDPELVRVASEPVQLRSMGLLDRDSSGQVIPAKEESELLKIFLPFGAMMLMFMAIFMSSQPMLESVLEEKSQRIAEVLLGSVSTFQLMIGKLLGTVGGSLTVFCIYLAGVMVVAQKSPTLLDGLPAQIVPWFVAFQVLGVLFYAAIFMAVGASVSQIKEAQSMLMPVWLLMMIPIFVWMLILRSPNGSLARGLSFFPPSTPTAIVMRLATGVSVPLWELILGLVLLAAATVLTVFFAGRIFRAGILWQGKTPRFSELLRWAWAG